MDILDKKNWGQPIHAKHKAGEMRRGANGEYAESDQERLQRQQFDLSHSFYKGQKVLIIKTSDILVWQNGQIIGEVSRAKTEPGTGPCIRVTYGGVGINIWNPNEDLLVLDTICELLYK